MFLIRINSKLFSLLEVPLKTTKIGPRRMINKKYCISCKLVEQNVYDVQRLSQIMPIVTCDIFLGEMQGRPATCLNCSTDAFKCGSHPSFVDGLVFLCGCRSFSKHLTPVHLLLRVSLKPHLSYRSSREMFSLSFIQGSSS